MIKFWSKFLYILVGGKAKLLLILVLQLVSGFLDAFSIGLVGPFISIASDPQIVQQNPWMQKIYVALNLGSTNHFIALLGLVILIAFYFKTALNFLIQQYIFRFSFNQWNSLRSKLFHSYLAVPYTFHLQRNSSDLINAMLNETSHYANGVLVSVLNIGSNLIVLVILLCLLMATNLVATVVISGLLMLTFLPFYLFKDKVKQWGYQSSTAGAKVIQAINHGLGGLKETKVIGCEPHFEAEVEEIGKVHAIAATNYSVIKMLPRMTIEAVLITFLIGLACIFLLTGNQSDLVPVLGIFAMASIRLLPSMNQISNSITTLRFHAYSINKIYSDLKEIEQYQKTGRTKSSHTLPTGNNGHLSLNARTQAMPFQSTIALKEVTFTYPAATDPSLKGVSITIKKGQSIALIGKSGAGKTTLVDVILGLLQPQGGDITVDGVSIYDNLRSWQNLVGYIPQSIFLSDETIERNIAFGVPDGEIDPERLDKAIKAAQLRELVDSLPDGVKTSIGERGVRLSGGQRQRIGIARALYHEREILVLDEATAALDNETEALVTESIKSLSGTKTMIIIAHRLSTVEHCDLVYKMEKGQVVASGGYRQIVLGEEVVR